jgi:hypothetical protein
MSYQYTVVTLSGSYISSGTASSMSGAFVPGQQSD